jgi:hypothetical protein
MVTTCWFLSRLFRKVVVALSVRSPSAKLLGQLAQLAQLAPADQGFLAPLSQLTELKAQEKIHG